MNPRWLGLVVSIAMLSSSSAWGQTPPRESRRPRIVKGMVGLAKGAAKAAIRVAKNDADGLRSVATPPHTTPPSSPAPQSAGVAVKPSPDKNVLALADTRDAKADESPRNTSAPIAQVDVNPAALAWIPSGTPIGDSPPPGWSHLVLLANPRFGVGDVDSIPSMVVKNAKLFFFTILANVAKTEEGYRLDKFAVGYAIDVNGRREIRFSDDRGLSMGMISKMVFAENEKIIERDLRQVARTPTMIVFDAKSIVAHQGEHRLMMIRHAIVVNPRNGELTPFVWLLDLNRDGPAHRLVEATMQRLPRNFVEDRVMSVNAQKFNFLGVPAWDAIAMARIPQGTPVPIPLGIAGLAEARAFTRDGALSLEAQLLALTK